MSKFIDKLEEITNLNKFMYGISYLADVDGY